MNSTNRRTWLGATGALLLIRPARAEAPAMDAAIRHLTGGVAPREGRVRLELAELVENGNAVPVTVSVDSPMTPADHVRTIALFTARNPAPEVAIFRLGARAGRAQVATRIRLATSGRVVALAQTSDGAWWSHAVDVLVTLAACVEG